MTSTSRRRPLWPVHARLAATLLAMAAALAGSAGAALAEPAAGVRTRHVLFLNSYQPGFRWSDDVFSGVTEVLSSQPYPVEVWVEYMDTRRFTAESYRGPFEALLVEKYRDRSFDAIVVSDDAALEFLLERHERQFPAVPVVFCGINNPELVHRAPPALFTGLREVLRSDDVIDFALQMRPQTTEFVVINDATATAAVQRDRLREIAAARPDLSFTFLDGALVGFDELLVALNRVSREAAVITTAFTLDRGGRHYPRNEALARIVAAARAPVYSRSISELGQGIVAGAENRGVPHGRRAGRMVAALLSGRRPAEIPRESDGESRFVVDVTQLARWGIARARLPSDAILLNTPSSFYQANWSVIWGGVGFMLLQALVIGALAVNISRRRRAERESADRARRLKASKDQLERANRALMREIGEREAAEENLRQAQRIEAVGRLAGGVAHDFNNLLTVIISYADLVLESVAEPSASAGVREIRRASERAATLTQQLLAFGRKQVLRPSIVDLNAIVCDVEPMITPLLGESVTLEWRPARETPAALVDRGQMEQVLINLAVNARDAMPRGGCLTIATDVVSLPSAEAPPDCGPPGRYARLIVRDTGVGMDDEVRARAFEPFFTTKDVGRGTGLGLSTAYGIIKQSGGWIWIDSAPEKGTTCTIQLPLAPSALLRPAPAIVHAEPAPAPSLQAQPAVLLLAEDQPEVRGLVASILRREGFDLLVAGGGREALELARTHQGPIDLLVTDVIMPSIGGVELATELRGCRPAIRVLFISGHNDQAMAEQGLRHPPADILFKPFTPDVLVAKVREALSGAPLEG